MYSVRSISHCDCLLTSLLWTQPLRTSCGDQPPGRSIIEKSRSEASATGERESVRVCDGAEATQAVTRDLQGAQRERWQGVWIKSAQQLVAQVGWGYGAREAGERTGGTGVGC